MNLGKQLIVPDGDFYSPATLSTIENQVRLTENLVYPITTEGEKSMKADATAINGFATDLDKAAAAIYKAATDQATKNRAITKGFVSTLKANRQRIISQFEAKLAERLEEVREIVHEALNLAWDNKGVKLAFRFGEINDIKESSLTDKGNLTASTKALIENIAQSDLVWQNEIESRTMTVELACHRAGISTPFTPEYIGVVFNDPDRSVFENRLNCMVKAEVERMEAAKAKIIAEQEAIKQREIQAALEAQQAEANRLAQEQAQAEQEEKKRIREANEKAERERLEEEARLYVNPLVERCEPNENRIAELRIMASSHRRSGYPTVSDIYSDAADEIQRQLDNLNEAIATTEEVLEMPTLDEHAEMAAIQEALMDESIVDVLDDEPANYKPTRNDYIELVAHKYRLSTKDAEQALINAFSIF